MPTEFVCLGCGEMLREDTEDGIQRETEDGVKVYVHHKCACEGCLHPHDFFFVEVC